VVVAGSDGDGDVAGGCGDEDGIREEIPPGRHVEFLGAGENKLGTFGFRSGCELFTLDGGGTLRDRSCSRNRRSKRSPDQLHDVGEREGCELYLAER